VTRYFQMVQNRMDPSPSLEVLKAMQQLNYDGDDGLCFFKLLEKDYPEAEVFIELDDEAARTWQEYRHALELRDRRERWREFARLRPQVARYLVSVSPRLVQGLSREGGLFYVPRARLKDYYDDQVGFLPTLGEDEGIW